MKPSWPFIGFTLRDGVVDAPGAAAALRAFNASFGGWSEEVRPPAPTRIYCPIGRVEAVFGIRAAWRPLADGGRWEVRAVRDPTTGLWTDRPPPEAIDWQPLPMIDAARPWTTGIYLGGVGVWPGATPTRPGIAALSDSLAVSWAPPLNRPVPGDLLLGELGEAVCGGPRRVLAGADLPDTQAAHEAASLRSLHEWGAQLARLGAVTNTGQPVALEILESDIDDTWDAARGAHGLDGGFQVVGPFSGGQSRFETRLASESAATLQDLESSVRAAIVRLNRRFEREISGPLAVLQTHYIRTLHEELQRKVAAIRSDLNLAINHCQEIVSTLDFHSYKASTTELRPDWVDGEGVFRTPARVVALLDCLATLADLLIPTMSSTTVFSDDAEARSILVEIPDLVRTQGVSATLEMLADWLLRIRGMDPDGLRQKRERGYKEHGVMCAAAALAVVGSRVPVRLLSSSPGFFGHPLTPGQKVVRSCSFGEAVRPENPTRLGIERSGLVQSLQTFEPERVLFVLAVSNSTAGSTRLERNALLGGQDNVILVGGSVWVRLVDAGIARLEPHASESQHGYLWQLNGTDLVVPDVCASTYCDVKGGSMVYPMGDGSWRLGSGSSQAAPIVAAACALLWQLAPGFTAKQVKEHMLKHTTKLLDGAFFTPAVAPGATPAFTSPDLANHPGACCIDLAAALTALGSSSPGAAVPDLSLLQRRASVSTGVVP